LFFDLLANRDNARPLPALPLEVWLAIFLLVDERAHGLVHLARVCKAWYRMLQSPMLLAAVSFADMPFEPAMLPFLRQCAAARNREAMLVLVLHDATGPLLQVLV
jgi:hypothetical protein